MELATAAAAPAADQTPGYGRRRPRRRPHPRGTSPSESPVAAPRFAGNRASRRQTPLNGPQSRLEEMETRLARLRFADEADLMGRDPARGELALQVGVHVSE